MGGTKPSAHIPRPKVAWSAGAQQHPHGSQVQVLGPKPQKKESAMSLGLAWAGVCLTDRDEAVWSHLLPT